MNDRFTDWLITIVVLTGFLFVSPSANGDCRQFFVQHKVAVQAVQAVVAPVVYPQVYYQAGHNIELRAAIREALAAELPALRQALSSGHSQAVTAPSVFGKCVRCHSGANAKAGVVLDGTAAVSCHTYARYGEMAGLGRNIPPEMKALVESLTPQEKGDINAGMLELGAADRPKPVVVPEGELH